MTTPADRIFVGGRVVTMADSASEPSALAVRDGVIVAVGDDDVLELRGDRTEVVDLDGGALLPGFVDAHLHAVAGGLARLGCDLSGVHSLEDYRRIISDFAAAYAGPWIEGSGWYGDVFPGGFPTKEELDRLVPDRPAVFVSHDVHSTWVNSRALEAAGIDRSTPDPQGGRITRDEHGEPTGQLMEMASELLSPFRPRLSSDVLDAALVEAQSYLHSVGITSWQDALVGELFGIPDCYDVYARAATDGTLRSRVTGALFWVPGRDLADAGELIERRRTADARFRTTAVKVALDGVCENLTAALHEHYAGHPDECGLPFFGAEEIAAVARLFSSEGFDLHMHAVGDKAVSTALDALTGLPDAGARRHQVAHIDLIRLDDVGRMREVGAIANVSPLWARQDPVLVETKLPLLTADQQARHFLFGSLRRGGVPVAFGSDWPVSTPDPIAGLHTAVNRTAAPGDPHASDLRSRTEPLLAHERLSLDDALRAATWQAARAARLDEHAGVLAVGRAADLVVLDHDPYAVERVDLGEVRVAQTFVAGERVFAR
ncbi:MAG TPA: amidohydrolase [Candidatus Nanopelagicales bacterium]|nr:amidohydrolase [Candidatus Nanopelagicales bacterium]